MKKFLSLLLSLTMLLSCCPVYAEDLTQPQETPEIIVNGTLEDTQEQIEELVEEIFETDLDTDPAEPSDAEETEEIAEEAVEEAAEEPNDETVEIEQTEEVEEAVEETGLEEKSEPTFDIAEELDEEAAETPTESETAEAEVVEILGEEPLENDVAEEKFLAEEEETEETAEEVVEEAEEFDPAKALEYMLSVPEEEARAYYDELTTEEQDAIITYVESLPKTEVEEEPAPIPAVNFTKVAPFGEPVTGRKLMKALKAAPAKERLDNEGVETTKTVTKNGDGTYTLKLESFVTGKKITSTVTKDIPTDIVLVLDQSGSMDDNISSTTYAAAYPGTSHNGTYYVKNGDSYIPVTWCSDCQKWTNGCRDTYFIIFPTGHDEGTIYVPKTSSTDNTSGHVQFYSRSTSETKKLNALKTAVTTFIDAVYTKSKGADGISGNDDDVDHRIAVVGFASKKSEGWYSDGTYNNTELLSTTDVINYANASETNYKDSLVTVSVDGVKNPLLNTAIGRLAADGDTYSEYGIDMANKIFAQNPISSGQERNRVVIVFTDGYPAPANSSRFNYPMADNAIKNAYTTKNTYKATVYTVGIFENADPSSSITNNYQYNGTTTTRQKVAADRYMHYMSSNYLTVDDLSDVGVLNDNADPFNGGDSYYLSANNTDSLNEIFQQISEEIQTGGAKTTLTEETVVKDVISDSFEIPSGAGKVTAYSMSFTGDANNPWITKNDDGPYTPTVSTDPTTGKQTVSVSGFDFSENYVGIDDNNGVQIPRGKQLVIEIIVEPKDGFLGGNGVPTNDDNSGIYSGDECVEEFKVPTADVAIPTFTIEAADKNVYATNGLTSGQLKDGLKITINGSTQDFSTWYNNLADWQKEYVTITNGDIAALSNLLDDTTYTATVSIEPDSTGTVSKVEKSDYAKINVFKPAAAFQDSVIYLTQTPDYETENLKAIKWIHGDVEWSYTGTPTVTMTGEEPTVAITYEPATPAFTDCTTVTPTLKIGTQAVGSADPATFTVHVLKPTVTWDDEFCYYGDTISISNKKPVDLSWTCKDKKSAATNGSTAPGLTYSFSWDEEEMPDIDCLVDVTVEAGETDITAETTQIWEKCEDDSENAVGPTQFLIHPKFCSLTISKTVEGNADPDQLFVFNVTDGDIAMSVSVEAEKSVTINRLPVGEYTVTEDMAWAWDYECDEPSQSAELTSAAPSETLAFENKRQDEPWYYDIAQAIKNVFQPKPVDM